MRKHHDGPGPTNQSQWMEILMNDPTSSIRPLPDPDLWKHHEAHRIPEAVHPGWMDLGLSPAEISAALLLAKAFCPVAGPALDQDEDRTNLSMARGYCPAAYDHAVGQVLAARPRPDAGLEHGYEESASRLRDIAADLGAYLAVWSTRGPDDPGALARGAASEAVTAIDEALAVLHRVRFSLAGEIRVYDDAAFRYADELLARLRAEREDGGR